MATLFCYGTLEFETVITRLIGYAPDAEPAVLENFARYRIADTDFPGIKPKRGEQIQGSLYKNLSPKEIKILDEYEGSSFSREQTWIRTREGRLERCWVYVVKAELRRTLTDEPWNPAQYFNIRSRVS
ncbi:gamma-glutamylcyclotransferase family protein [Motiliproteus sp. MSK22-1]|uniref:gamma-glutamylcyclotransferase family protein n=1 Tax=Motiliproteus sp. MSK22-1 TaxID=1897630 RepID=UPI0009764E0B|nr:gamma-glutamylcyclotransferase family protein [Motiliproteus sp. MSK22-1]OMH32806.1 hypothetical protein BGP75_14890 [Motiliproteus sp. MSK22-1]